MSSVRVTASHEPLGSAGCGSASPFAPGRTSVARANFKGSAWLYRVYVPRAYDPSTPLPLIVQHPGWGMSAKDEEEGAGITQLADALGFLSVTAQGQGDNDAWGGPWYSWNAVGTTRSPGPAGPICTQAANSPSYCYTSCAPCGDAHVGIGTGLRVRSQAATL